MLWPKIHPEWVLYIFICSFLFHWFVKWSQKLIMFNSIKKRIKCIFKIQFCDCYRNCNFVIDYIFNYTEVFYLEDCVFLPVCCILLIPRSKVPNIWYVWCHIWSMLLVGYKEAIWRFFFFQFRLYSDAPL